MTNVRTALAGYLAVHPNADNLQWEFSGGGSVVGTQLSTDPKWVESMRNLKLPSDYVVYIQKTDDLVDRTPGTWEEYTILTGFKLDGETVLVYKYDSKTKEVTSLE